MEVPQENKALWESIQEMFEFEARHFKYTLTWQKKPTKTTFGM